jgi:hypothetical protein
VDASVGPALGLLPHQALELALHPATGIPGQYGLSHRPLERFQIASNHVTPCAAEQKVRLGAVLDPHERIDVEADGLRKFVPAVPVPAAATYSTSSFQLNPSLCPSSAPQRNVRRQ